MNSSEPRKTFLFAGGGTGGHLAPALAIIEQLNRLAPTAAVLVACTHRPIDKTMLDAAEVGYVPQPVQPVPRSPLGWVGFYRTWRRSLSLASRMIKDIRPSAVLGLGGFAAGPVVRVAAGLGVPSALLNPDAVPGKANRYLAGRAEAIFTQFESSAAHFAPPAAGRCRAVGCPIRPSVLGGDRGEALELWQLDPGRRTLAVMGGSLGAKTINEAALALAAEANWPGPDWQVLHVTGPGKSAEARRTYQQSGAAGTVIEYCGRMDLLYAVADILIGRAGANTVAELAATGTPSVLLPYPFHRDQHQLHNAQPLAEAGGAVIVEDTVGAAENAARLRAALDPLLKAPSKLDAMAGAARSLARPEAAEAVARWLIEQ